MSAPYYLLSYFNEVHTLALAANVQFSFIASSQHDDFAAARLYFLSQFPHTGIILAETDTETVFKVTDTTKIHVPRVRPVENAANRLQAVQADMDTFATQNILTLFVVPYFIDDTSQPYYFTAKLLNM